MRNATVLDATILCASPSYHALLVLVSGAMCAFVALLITLNRRYDPTDANNATMLLGVWVGYAMGFAACAEMAVNCVQESERHVTFYALFLGGSMWEASLLGVIVHGYETTFGDPPPPTKLPAWLDRSELDCLIAFA